MALSFAETRRWRPLINAAAGAFRVDPALIEAMMYSESTGQARLRSRSGAKGLMQLMPGTAKELGVRDAFDPVQNVTGAAKYLRTRLLDRFNGDLVLSVAGYNAGPNRKDLAAGRVPPRLRETVEYVTRVFERYERLTGESVDYMKYMVGQARVWAEREAARLQRQWRRGDEPLAKAAAAPGAAPAPRRSVPEAAPPAPQRPPEVSAFALTASAPALSAPPAAGTSGPGPAVTVDPGDGKAVGSTRDGRLVNGVHLPPSGPGYRSIRVARGNQYGTGRLVAGLQWLGETMHSADPSAPPISIGDLSAKAGGDISHHATHENGTNVDIVLPWKDSSGSPVFSAEFVSLDPTGSYGGKTVSLDAARAWRMVEGLARNPYMRVIYAEVDPAHVAAIRAYARSIGADLSPLRILVPRKSPPHKDHFHIRVE